MHPPQHQTAAQPRVAYVVKRYPRFSETFIVNEVLAHEAAGLDVEIVSLFGPSDTHFQDILARVRAGVTYLPPSTPKSRALWEALQTATRTGAGADALFESARGSDVRTLHQALHLADHVRARGITHLHAHFASGATAVARLAAALAEVPYSFTAHAKDIFHESVDHEELRAKLRDASAVVTVSDYNRRYLEATFGLDAGRVRRVYNGLDLADFEFDAPARRAATIVAVGRLVEKKGFDVLVDACAELRLRGVDARCEIIGAGEERDRLARQVADLGLASMVTLVGPLPQRDLKARVRAAAVLAAPCVVGSDANQDGLPTVLLEAMALGTPCVSTDVTGIPEAVIDGETGLIVRQRDPRHLADALQRMLGDAGERVALARRARTLIEERFDISRNAAEVRSLFTTAARTEVPHAHRVRVH
jgi:colanic acid/amylovoran biosynthesis glycosyltransferase